MKVFLSFLLVFELCFGRHIEIIENTESVDTIDNFNQCITDDLKSKPEINDTRADVYWYSFVQNSAYFSDGELNEIGEKKAIELCDAIKNSLLPSWRICVEKFRSIDSALAEAALSYADHFLLSSCMESPKKSVDAHICLNAFVSNFKSSTNYTKLLRKGNVTEKKGPKGILCKLYVGLLSKYGYQIKLCGWEEKALKAMINNKIARSASYYKIPFTPLEACEGINELEMIFKFEI